MKIRINTQVIEALKPCEDRLVIWLENHKYFDGDIVEFLELEKISLRDKIWVTVRVMPRFSVEVFAIDCALSAASAAASSSLYAASYAAVDAAYAAESAAYAAESAARTQELENQVDALIMLIKVEKEL